MASNFGGPDWLHIIPLKQWRCNQCSLCYSLSLEQDLGGRRDPMSFAENWSGRVAEEHELQGLRDRNDTGVDP